jgi:hypothetical protein
MSGYTPPPGVYFSDTFYLYSASAATNGNFPFGDITAAGIKVNFITNIAATAWYTDVKILGGTLGFAAAVPVGSDTNSAAISFIGPLGFNRQLNRTDSAVSIGDSAYSASLGWEAGEHHWNVALTGLAPTGHYAPNSLAIMSLNRPGFDIKGAYTFLSMQTGTEISGAVGVTFNLRMRAENCRGWPRGRRSGAASVPSARASVSSMSTSRYRTVLSIFVWPSNICTARRDEVVERAAAAFEPCQNTAARWCSTGLGRFSRPGPKASPPKPLSKSRRNAPHPTTRKWPRETLRPFGREPSSLLKNSGFG